MSLGKRLAVAAVSRAVRGLAKRLLREARIREESYRQGYADAREGRLPKHKAPRDE